MQDIIMDEADNTVTYSTKNIGFHIAHINIRSMKNKLLELYTYVPNMNFDVFSISETWLNESFPEKLLQIGGYYLLRLNREWKDDDMRFTKKGGGLAIYINRIYFFQ